MKFLLSYTTKHFDPVQNKVIYGHSIGREAKIYYDVLSEFGEVTYIDSASTDHIGHEYDLMVSLPRNFGFLTANNKIKKTICSMNIPEPSYLYEVMSRDAGIIGCKLSDCFRPQNFYHADKFLMLGDSFNADMFVAKGMDRTKIVLNKYGMDDFEFKPRDKNERPVFLHMATTLGLRKGFYHVIQDFLKADLDAELWCVGAVQKEKRWLEIALEAAKDPRIKIIGWVDCYDPKYLEILYGADFIVFPSWGEGQPGTVMEAVATGCLPIVSKESGFPYYPITEYIRGDVASWKAAASMKNETFRAKQLEMKDYVEHNLYSYKTFEDNARNTVRELLNEK